MQSLLDQNRRVLSFNSAADAAKLSAAFASFFPGNRPKLVKLLSILGESCGHTCFMEGWDEPTRPSQT